MKLKTHKERSQLGRGNTSLINSPSGPISHSPPVYGRIQSYDLNQQQAIYNQKNLQFREKILAQLGQVEDSKDDPEEHVDNPYEEMGGFGEGLSGEDSGQN